MASGQDAFAASGWGNVLGAILAAVFAVIGGRLLGLEWSVAWILAAVPVVFSIFRGLRGPIVTLSIAFGLFALLWVYTPLPKAVDMVVEKVSAGHH